MPEMAPAARMLGITAASIIGSLSLVYVAAMGIKAYETYQRNKYYVEVTDETERMTILDYFPIMNRGNNPRVFRHIHTGSLMIQQQR